MGLGFGAGSSTISYAKTSDIGKAVKSNGLDDALITLGKTMGQDSKSQALAVGLDGKESVTDAQLGELFLTIAEESRGGLNVDPVGDGSPVPSQPDTKTATKPETESPYNSAPLPDLSKFSDIDIRTHELLAAQAPTRASVVGSDVKFPTVNTPKSTPTQSNGGGGDLDAPRQTLSTEPTVIFIEQICQKVQVFLILD